MAPKQCDFGQFLHDLVIMPELRQLFKAHSVSLSYAWDLASSQQALPLKKHNASSQSLSFTQRQRNKVSKPHSNTAVGQKHMCLPNSLRNDKILHYSLNFICEIIQRVRKFEMDYINLSRANFECLRFKP